MNTPLFLVNWILKIRHDKKYIISLKNRRLGHNPLHGKRRFIF